MLSFLQIKIFVIYFALRCLLFVTRLILMRAKKAIAKLKSMIAFWEKK